MQGLLDFIQTPGGQGLLSAAFGGMATARRGAPMNSLGAAGLAGLLGYQNATNRKVDDEYKQIQMQKLQQDAAQAERRNRLIDGLMGGGSAGAAAASYPVGGQQSPQGGVIGGLGMDQIGALKLAGVDLVDLYKMSREGIKREAGNWYEGMDGGREYIPKVPEGVTWQNGQAVPVPGAAQSNAAYRGAEAAAVERAKAGLDPMKVYDPQQGREVYMPRAAVAGGGQQAGMPLESAVMTAESNGNQNAVSPKGASGMMQLMPRTAAGLGVNPADALENVAGGVSYLSQMRQKYGDDRLALAAYNWGPGNVDKWLKGGADWSKLPSETRNYISKIERMTGGLNQPQAPDQSQPQAFAAGPSADEVAAQEAARVKAVEQAKADVSPTSGKRNSIANFNQILSVLDTVEKHPGFSGGVGWDRIRSVVPGTKERDFAAAADQLQGAAFLQAFESLKGGGAITEIEGKKAEQAIARLDRSQSEESYRAALKDFREVIQGALQRSTASMPEDQRQFPGDMSNKRSAVSGGGWSATIVE